MDKKIFPFFAAIVFLFACNQNNTDQQVVQEYDSLASINIKIDSAFLNRKENLPKEELPTIGSNQAFKDVKVERGADNNFVVTGKARVFEANVEWVVEDGHDELYKGYTTASKGAPEWGEFTIKLKANKVNENTKLHLLLFESSANDGSRVNQLPVYLY